MSAIISYENHAVGRPLSSPIGPDLGFPLANLQTRQLSQVARWTQPGTQKTVEIIVDLSGQPWGNRVNIPRVAALLGVNRSISDIQTGHGLVAYYSSGDENGPWTQCGMSFVQDESPAAVQQHLICLIDAPARYGFWRLVGQWPSADPHASVGGIWLGNALEFPEGCLAGWSISTIDTGTVSRAAGGEVYPDVRRRLRRLNMSFSQVTEHTAFGINDENSGEIERVPSWQEMAHMAGTTGAVIAMPRAGVDSPALTRRTAIYGRLSEQSLVINHTAGPYYHMSAEIAEDG